jgi:hypothetical protein
LWCSSRVPMTALPSESMLDAAEIALTPVTRG